MANTPDLARPFSAFNFEIQIDLPFERTSETEGARQQSQTNTAEGAGQQTEDYICKATFSECSGLEMSIAPKTIREGGNNSRQIHLMGPVGYGQLSLKRGVTPNMDLWDWFEIVQTERAFRADAHVIVKSPNRHDNNIHFELTGCLPLKLRAPALNAKDGSLAIEEMQIAYETLRRVKESA